ncbi:MAG: CopD family protein [Myxococcales bacterium]|nr:CopD family protein [Myxococcales bacterium]
MRVLYFFSVWLHILAAITWIGGMLFLVLVVVPWMRQGHRIEAGAFLRETGVRFRNVGWTCFGILLVTGTFNLWVRGVRLENFTSPEWLSSSFGQTVVLKLAFFVAVLVVSSVHDFVVGPRATVAIERGPGSPEAMALRRRASMLGRLNLLFALVLVALGVMIVRGALW